MKEIIEKISSYNLFNYLFPGIIFVVVLRSITSIDLMIENNFLGAFLYYFIGLVISRIGSLIVSPLMKKFKLTKFEDYSDYISASKEDDKIELFSEVNNTYRTLIATFAILIFCVLYDRFLRPIKFNQDILIYFLLTGIIVLFVFSYMKQTDFITKRIKKTKK